MKVQNKFCKIWKISVNFLQGLGKWRKCSENFDGTVLKILSNFEKILRKLWKYLRKFLENFRQILDKYCAKLENGNIKDITRGANTCAPLQSPYFRGVLCLSPKNQIITFFKKNAKKDDIFFRENWK